MIANLVHRAMALNSGIYYCCVFGISRKHLLYTLSIRYADLGRKLPIKTKLQNDLELSVQLQNVEHRNAFKMFS